MFPRDNSGTSTASGIFSDSVTNVIITGEAMATTPMGGSIKIDKGGKGLSPKVYFKYIKNKFGILEKISMDRRIAKLQKLVNEAIDNGQEALSESFFDRLVKEMRESELYAKGYRIFIEQEHLDKFRYKIRGRAISVTPLKNYVKVIPKDVIEKIKKTNGLFDTVVIVHYDPDGNAKKLTKEEERKDPIAFGKIAESDRYYFIADWEDEYCDLTLDDIVDKLNLDENDMRLDKNPSLEN